MNRPFTILEEWVRQGRIHLASAPGATPAAEAGHVQAELREYPVQPLPPDLSDEQLFEFAMKDVKSLGWSAVPLHNRPPLEIQAQDDEQDALRVLEEFVREGNVEIEQTPEYIEGSVHPHGRLYLQDLRSGRFSVQAHVDLHGLNVLDARFVLEEFLLESVRCGFSCVRVIHGRGRHSHKHHPILKENIQRWLCTRRMSRHVIAYTSARRCDGGGGAVYVLLRR
jgi:DNA-nicking Smr family endonuclease